MTKARQPFFSEIPDLWHHVVETMDEALFLVDRHQRVVYFNRRAQEITGYSAEQVIGQHCVAAFGCPQCRENCGLFERERLSDVEVTITRSDGRAITALKNAVLLRDHQGDVVGGLETFRDISFLREQMSQCRTARNHAEERGKTLAAVLDSIHEGILALDHEHRVVSVTGRALEILGISDEEELLGLPCRQVLDSALCRDGCPLHPQLEDVREGSGTAHHRTTLTRDGRRIQVTEGLSPLVSDEGQNLGHLIILTELPQFDGDDEKASFFGLIGRSPAMAQVFERIRQLAHSEVTVLITGESGTGKELAARAVHQTSPRATGPFLAVNCAALPEGLLESEIFGHVKGAFTGALRDRAGRVEMARGGTLILDEIGEIPLPLQAKLLRLLQERTFERLGEDRTRSADIRIIAATNRDLPTDVAEGRFREDLYYRLKVVPLYMPPLRDRSQDVALLAGRLLERHSRQAQRQDLSFTRPALEALLAYHWPGNVRELVNTIEYVVALTQGPLINADDLPPEIGPRPPSPAPTGAPATNQLPAQRPSATPEPTDEASLLRQALERNEWHRQRTAAELGVNRVTLYRLMRRYGIEGPRGRRPSKIAKNR
jgi:PAS domain S-box-containing protein